AGNETDEFQYARRLRLLLGCRESYVRGVRGGHMKKKYNHIIRAYFSDYAEWLLLWTALFLVSVAAMIAIRGMSQLVYVCIVCFLIIFLLPAPLLVRYCKAARDIKTGGIASRTIIISEIQCDNRFNFKNNGGAIIGRTRYRMVDENKNVYLLAAANKKETYIGFHRQPEFSVELVYLEKSRLVVRMRIAENYKTVKEARKRKNNIANFKKVFRHYF
ncbi:MAG: hypothetical protein IIY16_06690, partial [Oscillospiraceae bacterium]|nr:hypothetical protein [Oscillospiraceae bacterium]